MNDTKGHIFSYHDESHISHYAVCTCGERTKTYVIREMVDVDVRSHLSNVARARRAMGERTESTRSAYEYYLLKSEDPNIDPDIRAQWKVLADGLAPRVKKRKVQDPYLPGMENLL